MLAAVADANKCSFLVAPAPSETDLHRHFTQHQQSEQETPEENA